jgi:hypothetical protein
MHQLGENSRYSPDSCESLNSTAVLSWEAKVHMNLAQVLSVRHIKCQAWLRHNHVTPLHPPPPRLGTRSEKEGAGINRLTVVGVPVHAATDSRTPSWRTRTSSKTHAPWCWYRTILARRHPLRVVLPHLTLWRRTPRVRATPLWVRAPSASRSRSTARYLPRQSAWLQPGRP